MKNIAKIKVTNYVLDLMEMHRTDIQSIELLEDIIKIMSPQMFDEVPEPEDMLREYKVLKKKHKFKTKISYNKKTKIFEIGYSVSAGYADWYNKDEYTHFQFYLHLKEIKNKQYL